MGSSGDVWLCKCSHVWPTVVYVCSVRAQLVCASHRHHDLRKARDQESRNAGMFH